MTLPLPPRSSLFSVQFSRRGSDFSSRCEEGKGGAGEGVGWQRPSNIWAWEEISSHESVTQDASSGCSIWLFFIFDFLPFDLYLIDFLRFWLFAFDFFPFDFLSFDLYPFDFLQFWLFPFDFFPFRLSAIWLLSFWLLAVLTFFFWPFAFLTFGVLTFCHLTFCPLTFSWFDFYPLDFYPFDFLSFGFLSFDFLSFDLSFFDFLSWNPIGRRPPPDVSVGRSEPASHSAWIDFSPVTYVGLSPHRPTDETGDVVPLWYRRGDMLHMTRMF